MLFLLTTQYFLFPTLVASPYPVLGLQGPWVMRDVNKHTLAISVKLQCGMWLLCPPWPCQEAGDKDKHEGWPSSTDSQRCKAGTTCPCSVQVWGWPSSTCSMQKGTLALSLASNTPSGRKTPYMFSLFKAELLQKSVTQEMKAGKERGLCCITASTHEIKELLVRLFLPRKIFYHCPSALQGRGSKQQQGKASAPDRLQGMVNPF